MPADILVTSAQHARDWFDMVTAGSAVFGLIVVTVYTTLTYKQWQEAKKANKLTVDSLEMSRQSLEQSKHAFEVSQRGRLRVTQFELTEPKVGPFIAKAYITNTGPLPATEVRMQATVVCDGRQSLLMGDVPRAIHQFDRSGPRDVIGSGATKELEAKAILDENIARWPVFFIGRVQYLDGFEKDQTLRFCMYWPATSAFPNAAAAADRSWLACYHHNRID